MLIMPLVRGRIKAQGSLRIKLGNKRAELRTIASKRLIVIAEVFDEILVLRRFFYSA
jgi:hypothetical protein